MTTFIKGTFKTLAVLGALMLATVVYAQNYFGPAGVFISVNEIEVLYRLNDESWGADAGDLSGPPANVQTFDGVDFGVTESLVIARGIGVANGPELNNRWRIFFRVVTADGTQATPWIGHFMQWYMLVGGVGQHQNSLLQADLNIDILALADELAGEGTYQLQIGVRLDYAAEPEVYRTATFVVEHGAVIVEPTIAIEISSFTLPINQQALFRVSGNDADSVSVYHNNVLFQTFTFPGETFSQVIQFIPRDMGDNWITAVAMNRFGFRVVNEIDFVVTDGSNRQGVTENSRYLQVFPNPATTYLVVQTSDIEVGTDIFIYNILGRLVATFQTTSENTVIDISDFSAGLHILRVGDFIVRWIKQ